MGRTRNIGLVLRTFVCAAALSCSLRAGTSDQGPALREVHVSQGTADFAYQVRLAASGDTASIGLHLKNLAECPLFLLIEDTPSVRESGRKVIVEMGAPHYHSEGVPRLMTVEPGCEHRITLPIELSRKVAEENFVTFIFYLVADGGCDFRNRFVDVAGDWEFWQVSTGDSLWKYYYEHLVSEEITFAIVPLSE